MKFPISWLNDFIELEKILEKENNNVNQIAEKLTKAGIEVEDIKELKFFNGKVVIGEVVEVSPHPTKNKLLVCEIDVKNGEYKIVVSADTTIQKGQKVVYCYPGTILQKDNTLIDVMEFENINSYGMLLSLEELSIEPKSETVWKINSNWEVGSELLSNILPPFMKEEFIFSVKVPSNRADVLSILGIARELSAIYSIPLRPLPSFKFYEELPKPDIKIQDKRCYRYCSRVVKNIKVKESNDIVKIRLLLSGQRPINNIVDITNYIMLAIGQPMHAFDYDKLIENKIIVRASNENEKILTLDDREIELPKDTLIIADGKNPVAIAGVIGGKETSITEETTSILLESAYFDHNTIRKTSKELGITTESSIRFSRDIGFFTTELAINLAVNMIGEGKVSSLTDVKSTTLKEDIIKTSFNNLKEKIGYEIPQEKIKSILTFLGFETQQKNEELTIKVPPYRKDISIEEDIVEEIARIYGYDNIPPTIPRIDKNPEIPSNILKLEQTIRNKLVAQGLTEVMNFSFISDKEAKSFGISQDTIIKISNPMISEDNSLRPTLMINLLKTIKRNLNNGFKNLSLFEIGKVFYKNNEEMIEEKNLCIALHGKKYENWAGNTQFSYYDLKDILDNLLISLGIKFSVIPQKYPFLHDYISGDIIVENEKVGIIGKLHPEISTENEIDDTYVCEISISKLEKYIKHSTHFKEINKLPVSSKNISVLVPKNYYVDNLVKFIKDYNTGNPNLKIIDVRVMDIYEGPNIPQDMKSINVLIKLQWVNEVKEETEIKVVFVNIIRDIQEKLNLSVRGV